MLLIYMTHPHNCSMLGTLDNLAGKGERDAVGLNLTPACDRITCYIPLPQCPIPMHVALTTGDPGRGVVVDLLCRRVLPRQLNAVPPPPVE